jgi:hypothetical protein
VQHHDHLFPQDQHAKNHIFGAKPDADIICIKFQSGHAARVNHAEEDHCHFVSILLNGGAALSATENKFLYGPNSRRDHLRAMAGGAAR